jgi:hypothetical protein
MLSLVSRDPIGSQGQEGHVWGTLVTIRVCLISCGIEMFDKRIGDVHSNLLSRRN